MWKKRGSMESLLTQEDGEDVGCLLGLCGQGKVLFNACCLGGCERRGFLDKVGRLACCLLGTHLDFGPERHLGDGWVEGDGYGFTLTARK